jgi:hypothetical protein
VGRRESFRLPKLQFQLAVVGDEYADPPNMVARRLRWSASMPGFHELFDRSVAAPRRR